MLHAGRSRVRFLMVSLEFSLTSFRLHSGPGVDSASDRNEYQEYFLGGKGGRCVGLHVPIVLKAESLNLLEPLGPVQVCTGIVLPLLVVLFTVYIYCIKYQES